jgi:hypothetical protein
MPSRPQPYTSIRTVLRGARPHAWILIYQGTTNSGDAIQTVAMARLRWHLCGHLPRFSYQPIAVMAFSASRYKTASSVAHQDGFHFAGRPRFFGPIPASAAREHRSSTQPRSHEFAPVILTISASPFAPSVMLLSGRLPARAAMMRKRFRNPLLSVLVLLRLQNPHPGKEGLALRSEEKGATGRNRFLKQREAARAANPIGYMPRALSRSVP